MSNADYSPDRLVAELARHDYLVDRGLATVLSVALRLGRPLLLEGDAGVGKTELARALSEVLDTPLVRLQCHQGMDVAHALYDWNYARQMLHLRTLEVTGMEASDALQDVFSEEFLVRRPLLSALESHDDRPRVLLIDEVDRADDEFEAFLLELLSDFQVTSPELGTIRATVPPVVILTSNRTRELHDALKRRCLYHWLGHPDFEQEVAIVMLRAPGISERLARDTAAAVGHLRELDLIKPPGVAETIDWARALDGLDSEGFDPVLGSDTLGAVLKHREDLELARTVGVAAPVNEARYGADTRP